MEEEIITNIAPLIMPHNQQCFFCDVEKEVVAFDISLGEYCCDDCLEDAILADIMCQFNFGKKVKKRQ